MFTTIIYIFRNSPFITPCTTPHGPTKCISAIVLDTFKLFFTPAIMLTICDQSNLYAKQILSDVAYEKFDQFTIEELYAYFGFMVLMGVNQLPTLSDYWKCDSIYHYSPLQTEYHEIDFYKYQDVFISLITPYSQPQELIQHMTVFGRSDLL